jgi:uncharacterized protein
MVKAQARPEKEGFILVAFNHGTDANTQELYTDWQQDVLGHKSTPKMALDIPDNTATFDKRELRVLLPLDDFTDRASSGVPHSPIFLSVTEVTQGLFPGDQNTQRVLFRGRVMRTIRNFQGRNNLVAFFALTAKSRLDVPMGLPCNHHCVWNVFGRGCGLDVNDFDENGQIDSVDGQEVTVTTAAVTSKTGTYWRRGYMERGGLRIPIRDWSDADPTKFQMARRVPDDWISAGAISIHFVPGCDKTIETCRARYDNEEKFGGAGYAIPPYQPNFESPS